MEEHNQPPASSKRRRHTLVALSQRALHTTHTQHPTQTAGDYGFDPLNLAKEPSSLQRFTEAELIHCRWAMLGAAGVIAVEALGYGNWYDAQTPLVTGGKETWFGIESPFDLNTLLAIQFVSFAAAESQRGTESDAAKRCYPGGAFDPLGFAKGDVEALKLKEVKNGRLVRARVRARGGGGLFVSFSSLASVGAPLRARCRRRALCVPLPSSQLAPPPPPPPPDAHTANPPTPPPNPTKTRVPSGN